MTVAPFAAPGSFAPEEFDADRAGLDASVFRSDRPEEFDAGPEIGPSLLSLGHDDPVGSGPIGNGEPIVADWSQLAMVVVGRKINEYGMDQANRWRISLPLSHGDPILLQGAAGIAFAGEFNDNHMELEDEAIAELLWARFGASPDGLYWIDAEIQNRAPHPRAFAEGADAFRFYFDWALGRIAAGGPRMFGGPAERWASALRDACPERFAAASH